MINQSELTLTKTFKSDKKETSAILGKHSMAATYQVQFWFAGLSNVICLFVIRGHCGKYFLAVIQTSLLHTEVIFAAFSWKLISLPSSKGKQSFSVRG